jgi:hypothetical protein
MKRKIIASVVGIAASLALNSAHAQGRITLDNYNTYGPAIVYGSGPNQIAGTTAGGTIHNGQNGTVGTLNWTMGVYFALGDVTAGVGSDPSGFGLTSFNGLTLASGAGSTTVTMPAGIPGTFSSSTDFSVPGYTSGLVTVEVLVYAGGGGTYATAAYRGHSTAYTTTPATGSAFATPVGTGMSSFGVFSVPEPSTFALAGLGAAALMAFRRKK